MALNTRTLGEVQTYTKAQFGDTSGVQITDDDITRATNNACMEIASTNKVLRASATSLSIPGQDEYDKPGDCIQVTSVKYAGTLLRGVGFDEFQSMDLSDVTFWTQYGNAIVIGATPVDEAEIKVYYIQEPPKVVDSSDILPLPDRYFNRICEYVMAKMYELDEDWEAQQVNKKAFDQNLASLNYEEVNNNGPFSTIAPYEL